MKDLVSVIVNVSNKVDLLTQCLDSILCQTYTELEIILVDNGSVSGAAKICDDYKAKDKRIKVIHLPEMSAGAVKNIGLNNASGRFITFARGEDYMDITYIERLYCGLVEQETDVSFCRFKKYFASHNEKVFEKALVNGKSYSLNFDEFVSNVFCMEDGENAIHCISGRTMFDLATIRERNIAFDESIEMWEDAKFLFDYLKVSNSYYVVDEYLYYYWLDENSVVKYNDNFITIRLDAYKQIADYVKDENVKSIIKFNLIWNLFYHELSSISSYYDKEKVQYIYNVDEYKDFKIKTYWENAKDRNISGVWFMLLIKMRMSRLLWKMNREKEYFND